MPSSIQMLPEWAPQQAVILAWPDQHTDWAPWLAAARGVYLNLIEQLNQAGVGVILLIKDEETNAFIRSCPPKASVLMVSAEYNDTWVRDYGFITRQSEHGMLPVEFVFNGWGQKFNAAKDNQANQRYLAPLCCNPIRSVDLVAEGGALEIDQHGILLSTHMCLFNPLRNGDISEQRYAQTFATHLGADKLVVLEHGHLQGDDTDGHIDTLVRFTPYQGLVIQSCFNRPDDHHYPGLSNLVNECAEKFPQHQITELPLPLVVNEDGERLPASYANYLICNNRVLVPVYRQPEDELALQRIANAYPEFQIVAVDCLALVQQFGSLHCITMQVPDGTLKPEVVQLFSQGVSHYGQ